MITVGAGVYPGLSYDDYAAIAAVRSSDLKGFRRSALHARYAMQHPAESATLMLGQAVHAALLEPDKADALYVAVPKVDGRTSAGKAAKAAFAEANQGRIILSADDYAEALALSDAARAHPVARELLGGDGENELSLVWRDAETSLMCKARLDRRTNHRGHEAIIELKTTTDAGPRGFARQVDQFGYHMSAAWYLRGLDALDPSPRRFIFIALEKGEPHAVACYELDELFLAVGRAECDRALRAYARARAADSWPGYPERITTLAAPGWLSLTPEPEVVEPQVCEPASSPAPAPAVEHGS